MSKNRKPLKRSILIGIVVFVVALCVAIGCYQYLQYNQMLHEKYRVHIENVLNYTEACIDVDDMEKCIKSGRESAIFNKNLSKKSPILYRWRDELQKMKKNTCSGTGNVL